MNQTPVSMGFVTFEELDPRWFEAVELLDSEMGRIERARMKQAMKK